MAHIEFGRPATIIGRHDGLLASLKELFNTDWGAKHALSDREGGEIEPNG